MVSKLPIIWKQTVFQPGSVVLEPGDLLYIPPMMVHHVEALSKPTIGFNVFSGSLVSELRSVHKRPSLRVRAELIGHFKPCMTDIYLHIDARMADYIRTHP